MHGRITLPPTFHPAPVPACPAHSTHTHMHTHPTCTQLLPPAPNSCPPTGDADLAAAAAAAAQSGGVGYCMLTFFIRNGLPALSLGLGAYLTFCNNLVRKMGLGGGHAGQVRGWGSRVRPPSTACALHARTLLPT